MAQDGAVAFIIDALFFFEFPRHFRTNLISLLKKPFLSALHRSLRSDIKGAPPKMVKYPEVNLRSIFGRQTFKKTISSPNIGLKIER